MSNRHQPTTRKSSDNFFRLKPLVAGVRVVIAGGLLVGSVAPVHAELPIPGVNIPGLPVPNANWVGYGSADMTSNGTNMNINQHSDRAILNWKSFDVAKDNSVQFVQPGSTSIALNRIDNNGIPSQILGHVAANGQIYLVNQNGFVFGKDSVVDTNSVVVSTLNITDDVFENSNIADAYNNKKVAALDGSGNTVQDGSITIANGAKIKAGKAGRIILAAPTVENSGSLSADEQGQILVIGSQDKVYLQANNPQNGSAWNGLLVEVGTGGKVTNTGTGNISVRQGNVTLAGFVVNQSGRVNATTSVNINGSIRLQAAEGQTTDSNSSLVNGKNEITASSTKRADGSVSTLTFGSGSVTQISPDTNGATIDDTAAAKAKPQSSIDAIAHTVDVQANAAIVAPGGSVSITATDSPLDPQTAGAGRIFIDKQATIDVSGIQNVPIAVDRDLAAISVQSFQLRNSPLQLNGVLKGKTVLVDTRQNTSIIDAASAAAAIQRGIVERMTGGGQIKLTSFGDVVVHDGATLNIAGGSLAYQDGYIHTTKLLDDYGRIVDISAADPNMHYAAIYGVVTEEHTKWGVTQTWNILDQFSQGQYRAGYIQGANAGSVNISAPLVFWNGSLVAGATSGDYQRATSKTPFGGSFNIDNTVLNSVQNVRFQTEKNLVDLALTSAFPTVSSSFAPLVLDASLLNHSGVQTVSVKTLGGATVADGTTIAMAPGGNLSVKASDIDIKGSIQASGGSISLAAAAGSVNLAKNTVLDVSGRWINDQQSLQTTPTPTDPLYIQGGSVTITAYDALNMPNGASVKADGGAWLSATGKLTAGKGGDIDLESSGLSSGKLQLAGTVEAYGLTQGGSLTLGNNNIVIGAADSKDPASALVLGVSNGNFDFASQLGFSGITLKGNVGNGQGGITVKSDVALNLQTENLKLQSNFQQQATGSSIRDFSSVVLLPENLRQAPQLTLTGGNNLALTLQTGSSITVDKSTASTASAINLVSEGGSIFADGVLNAPGGQINLTINGDSSLPYDASQVIWVGQHAELLAQGVARMNQPDSLGRQTGSVLNGGTVSLTANRGYAVLEKGSVIDVSGTHAPLVITQQAATGLGASFASTDVGSNAGKISISAAEGAVLDGELKGFAGSATTQAGSLALSLNNQNRKDTTPGLVFPNPVLNINVVQAVEELLPQGVKFGTSLDQQNLHGQMTVSANQIANGGFADLSLTIPIGNTGQVVFKGDVSLQTGGHIAIDSPVINWASNGASTGTVNLISPYLTLGSSSTRTVSGTATSGNGTFIADAQWMELQGASLWNGFNNITLDSAHDLRTVGILLGKRDFLGEMVTAATLNLQASQIYPATLTNFTFRTTGADRQINISGANTDVSPLSAGGSLTFQAPVINQGGVLKAPLGSISLIASKKLTLASGSVTSVSAAGQLIPYGVVQGGLDWLYPLDATQNQIISTPPTKQVILNAPVIDLAKGSTVDISGGGDLMGSEFKPVASDFPNFLQPGSKSYDGSFAILPALGSALAPYDPNIMSTWNDPKTGTNYAVGSQVYLNGTADLPAGQYTILPSYYALLPGAYLITPQSNSQDRSVTTYSTSGLPIVSGYELLAGTAVRDARSSAFQVETSAQLLQNHPQYVVYCASNCSNTIAQQEAQLKLNNQGVLAANLASSLDYLNVQKLLTENFYANRALAKDAATPLLPTDSGQISISAQSSLTLDGSINVAAPGGRGARMDIAADNIEVVSSLSATPASNTLQILDSSLNNLKVDSLFLGGTRTSNENIFSVSAVSLNAKSETVLTLSSTAGWAKDDILSGPGIADGTTIKDITGNTVTLSKDPVANIAIGALITDTNPARINGATNLFVASKQVTFDSGVQLKMTDLIAAATNIVDVKSGANLAASGTVNTGDSVFNLIGDSALLRLSADQQISVNRTYYSGTPGTSGQLTVESGATLSASQSMLLDSSYSTRMDGNIVMHGGSLSMSAGNINIGAASQVAGKLNALNLTNQQLAGLTVDQLILQSKGGVNFYGAVGQVDSNGNALLASDGSQKALTFKQLVINAKGISGFDTAGGQAVKLQADSLQLKSPSPTSLLTSAATDTTSNVLTLASTKGLAVGDHLTGVGLAANTTIVGISGNTVTLSALPSTQVSLGAAITNLGNASLGNGNGQGNLIISAGNFTQGAGNFAFNGFNAVNLNVGNSFTADGSSNLNVAADMNLSAGYLTAAGGSVFKLDATGHALSINGGGVAGAAPAGLGGAMTFIADKVVFDTHALLPSGKLSLEAKGINNGNVTIGSAANIDLAGRAVVFGNSLDYTPGGTFTATADNGSVTMDGGAQLDLSTGGGSAAGGNLVLKAVNQSVSISNSAEIKATGGSAQFDVSNFNGDSQGFDKLMSVLKTAGISNSIDFRARNADISSSTDITAQTVTLAADHGKIDISGGIHTNGITGHYVTSATANASSNVITLANIIGLQVGDYLSGPGLAANTKITEISGHNVTLNIAPTANMASGAVINDISAIGATHTITGLNQTTSNVIGLSSLSPNGINLKVGDVLAGPNLAPGTTIAYIPGGKSTFNGQSAYWLVLSAAPTGSLDPNGTGNNTIIDVTQSSAITDAFSVVHDNATWTPSNILTLDNTAGLQVGEYLVGAGLAANTTITGISGNNVTLSALPTYTQTDLSSANLSITTVDSSRVELINGGGINLYAGGAITLQNGGQLSAASAWGKGGQILLSSLTSASDAIVLNSGSLIDAGGVSANKNGSVTLRALWTDAGAGVGSGINIHVLNSNVIGNFYAEGVKVYSNTDLGFTNGVDGSIGSTFRDQVQTDTQTFYNNAQTAGLISSLSNKGITLLPGVEIDYSGNLTLASAWDLSAWRYGSAQAIPGDLVIRASGNLNFTQSLSDGFTSSGSIGTTDQLMSGASWSYTLTAGADQSNTGQFSANINQVNGVHNNLIVGTAAAVDASNPQVQIRTGAGNMQINAGGDITINGNGTIYNAGQASSQHPYGNLTNTEVSNYFLVEYPLNGGNLALSAGGNINGVKNNDFSSWLLRDCCFNPTGGPLFGPSAWGVALGSNEAAAGTQLNTGSSGTPLFQQNIGSFGGGNVLIKAAGDINNLEVAMPTTGKPVGTTIVTFTGSGRFAKPAYMAGFTSNVIDVQGGGGLKVDAGGNVQGGSYLLGQGVGSISAGGAVTGGAAWNYGPQIYSGNTQFHINAVNGVKLAGVNDPMTMHSGNPAKYTSMSHQYSFFSYTDASSVAVSSLASDIHLWGDSNANDFKVFPGSLQVSAFGGSVVLENDIALFPSSVGQLNIFAEQDILSSSSALPKTILMSDYAPNASSQALSTAYAPNTIDYSWFKERATDSSGLPLHLADLTPASFVTQSGDIKDIKINTPKLTIVKAKRDISNADINVQNIHNSDVTIIDAGRDLIQPIVLSSYSGKPSNSTAQPRIAVSGPGDVLVETGRNLNLGLSDGLLTLGDRYYKYGLSTIEQNIETNSALIRPFYVGASAGGANSNQLILGNATGLVVGEQLINNNLAANTIITAINGNTVTLSAKPVNTVAAGSVFATADTSSSYFAQAAASTESNQLILKDASGLLVGEQLTANGLAANTIITAISGNTVTLSAKPLQQIDAGALIMQATKGAPGSYVADVNNGANITVLTGLQGAAPDYVGFLNSDQKLQAYIEKLQLKEANASSSEQSALYDKTIKQYQDLETQFKANKQSATALITEFMQQTPGYVYTNDKQTLSDFASLPADKTLPIQSQLNSLLLPVLINEIKISGSASAADKTLGNDQGYAAINAFFPGANWKGDINLYLSTLQTDSGGDINLLAPGGSIDVGLSVEPSFSSAKAANQLGIIAQGQGSINAVVEGDFLVNTSRVFTLDGGDLLIWSSNGNIDAGKGSKSATAESPLSADYVYGNLTYTQSPSVSGSGIRTEGQQPGNVYLFAPQGVVNAAEAGIGGKNVTIAATAVLGAQNISFSGSGTGVPQASTGSIAAGLTGTSNMTAGVSQMAESSVSANTNNDKGGMKNAVLGMLSVEVLGFGE